MAILAGVNICVATAPRHHKALRAITSSGGASRYSGPWVGETGTPAVVSAKALAFNAATGSYFSTLTTNSPNTPQFSMNLWLFSRTNNTDNYQGICGACAETINGTSFGLSLWKTGSRYQFEVSDGSSSSTLDSGITATTGSWVMVTFVARTNATQTFGSFYTNAILCGTAVVSRINSANTNYLYVGQMGAKPVTEFRGFVDELGIWTAPLTPTEITNLYNGGSGVWGNVANPPFNANFKAGYHFDEGTGTSSSNFISGGTLGTLSGGASWTNGKVAVP